jgi:hypothetical protein
MFLLGGRWADSGVGGVCDVGDDGLETCEEGWEAVDGEDGLLSEEGVADDGRWILVVGGTDVFGDRFVLGEFEDGTGLGEVAMFVRGGGVGRGGGGGSVARLMEGGEGGEGWVKLEEFGRVREGGGFHGGVGEALGGEAVAREGRVVGEGGEGGSEGADVEVVDGGAGCWLLAWFGETCVCVH